MEVLNVVLRSLISCKFCVFLLMKRGRYGLYGKVENLEILCIKILEYFKILVDIFWSIYLLMWRYFL